MRKRPPTGAAFSFRPSWLGNRAAATGTSGSPARLETTGSRRTPAAPGFEQAKQAARHGRYAGKPMKPERRNGHSEKHHSDSGADQPSGPTDVGRKKILHTVKRTHPTVPASRDQAASGRLDSGDRTSSRNPTRVPHRTSGTKKASHFAGRPAGNSGEMIRKEFGGLRRGRCP